MDKFNPVEELIIKRATRCIDSRADFLDEAEVAEMDGDHEQADRLKALVAEADRVRDQQVKMVNRGPAFAAEPRRDDLAHAL